MLPNLEEYLRPSTLNEALRLLARSMIHTVPLAGGTALIPSRNDSVRAVVDLSALDLAGIEWQERPIRLGAMTTLQALASDPMARAFANGILAEAARVCAPRNVRNVATIGGTIISGGTACDLLATFLALDAHVSMRTKVIRTAALDKFMKAPGDCLGAGILIDLSIPVPAKPFGAALVRVARTPNDTAIVNAAALVVPDGLVCTRVRLAVGGVGTRVIRAVSIESALVGHAWDEKRLARAIEQFAAALSPLGDIRASSQYRREMAAVIAQRALTQAWANAQGAV